MKFHLKFYFCIRAENYELCYRENREHRTQMFKIEIGNLFNHNQFYVIWIWFAAKEFKEQKMKKEILIFCYLHFFERLIYSIKRQIINIHRNNTENKRLSTLWKVFWWWWWHGNITWLEMISSQFKLKDFNWY